MALLELKRRQLAERSERDPRIEAAIAEVRARVGAYEAARRPPTQAEIRSRQQDERKKAGIVQLGVRRDNGEIEPISLPQPSLSDLPQ